MLDDQYIKHRYSNIALELLSEDLIKQRSDIIMKKAYSSGFDQATMCTISGRLTQIDDTIRAVVELDREILRKERED